MKQQLSFRLNENVIEKLEKIRAYHKNVIQNDIISDIPITRTMVLEGLIEQMYFEMVQAGQIKEG
jgi:hypothetical protein